MRLFFVFWSFTIGHLNSEFRYVLWLSISFLIYWLGYSGIYHNGIFNQRKEIRDKNVNYVKSKKEEESHPKKINYLKELIEEEKLYLNPDFGLQNLSNKTGLNESYISHVFNKESSTNLTSYINELRITEAKKLLSDSNFKNYTIISIALESGFKSKSSFYTSFKKIMNETPTEYRKKSMS